MEKIDNILERSKTLSINKFRKNHGIYKKHWKIFKILPISIHLGHNLIKLL